MTEPTIDAVENESSAVRKHSNTWRVVDIVVAAIIAVASGVIFWGVSVWCSRSRNTSSLPPACATRLP